MFAENAQLYQLEVVSKIVTNMVLILLNSNANFAAQLPSGSVGVTRIFVKHAIKDNATEITFQESQEINYQNANLKNVHSR